MGDKTSDGAAGREESFGGQPGPLAKASTARGQTGAARERPTASFPARTGRAESDCEQKDRFARGLSANRAARRPKWACRVLAVHDNGPRYPRLLCLFPECFWWNSVY